MRTESEHLELEHILAVLRRRWWVIGLLTLVVAGAAFAFAARQTKEYTAFASLLFRDSQLSQQASGLQVTNNSPSSDPVIMGYSSSSGGDFGGLGGRSLM